MNNGLTFRSSKITYYGPHACSQCSVTICKMAQGFGGSSFNYPDGPIYPNTEWHVHVCNPRDILRQRAIYCKGRVQKEVPVAKAFRATEQGWFIGDGKDGFLSGNQTFYDTEDAAWIGAKGHVFPNEGEQSPEFDVIKGDLKPTSQKPIPQWATCKGSYTLKTACGHCERCQRELDNIRLGGSPA